MATDVKINDIASQLNTASRLVVSTDFFWIYMASGQQVKIPAEFVRAYLVNGVKPTINANGNWEIDGEDLGVVAKGKTPQFRGGTMGIEVSYDEGKTWTQAVAYTDMNPDLTALAEAYTKVTEGENTRIANENTRISNENARKTAETSRASAETSRANAENTRVSNENARKTAESTRESNESARKSNETTRQNQETTRQSNESTRKSNETTRESNESTRKTNETNRVNAESSRAKAETARVDAEKARVTAETKRESDFKTSKDACDAATANAKTATAASKTQTGLAEEINSHPNQMGDNGNWWKWNTTTKAYEDTGIVARGGAMYPTFKHEGNKLYIVDYGSNVSERVVKKGNKLVFRI